MGAARTIEVETTFYPITSTDVYDAAADGAGFASDGSTRESSIRVDLRYSSRDPYTVEFVFHPPYGYGEIVHWEFGRELLSTGLEGLTGEGSVQVWPWTTSEGNFVALALANMHENALFQMPRSDIARFVQQVFEAVPLGQEGNQIDVDAVISRLLESRK